MDYNRRLTESLAVLASLAPASYNAGAQAVGPVLAQNCKRYVLMVHVGSLGVAGTVDAKIQASTTSGGVYSDIPNAAITQITAGAENIVLVEITGESILAAGKGSYIKGVVTVGVNAVVLAAKLLGAVGGYEPANVDNATQVAQLVNA